jgi:hypothetical protein
MSGEPLKVTIRLLDGRLMFGYTPAFDPHDRSVWLTPTPRSPAGTMVELDKIKIVVLEPTDGRPVALPSWVEKRDPTAGVRLDFKDGDAVIGRQKARVDGSGLWLQPTGHSFARAFVPEGVGVDVEPFDADELLHLDEGGWDFLVPPPDRTTLAPPPRALATTTSAEATAPEGIPLPPELRPPSDAKIPTPTTGPTMSMAAPEVERTERDIEPLPSGEPHSQT